MWFAVAVSRTLRRYWEPEMGTAGLETIGTESAIESRTGVTVLVTPGPDVE